MTKPFDLSLMSEHELKYLSKPIPTYNNTLIDVEQIKRHVRVVNVREWHLPGQSYPNPGPIGPFDKLGLELLFATFEQSCITSLMNLRSTNSIFKAAIEVWPPYRNAMAACPLVVATLIATHTSDLWTFLDLASWICTSSCHFCGRHSEILHLLKMKRVCFYCLTTDRRLLAVTSTYVARSMGLTRQEIVDHIPRSYIRYQPSSFGLSAPVGFVYDYEAAVELAVEKRGFSFEATNDENTQPCGPPLFDELGDPAPVYTERRPKLKSNPIHVRRLEKRTTSSITPHNEPFKIPRFLLRPPAALYLQHLCSVYMPARHPATTPNTILKPLKAMLCAGCSFYFNYHNQLPHQAHTLYPTEKPNSSTNDTNATPLSPFELHLTTCPYARYYWNHIHPKPEKVVTPSQRAAYENHLLAILYSESSRYRHFTRHPIPRVGMDTVFAMDINNWMFEAVPRVIEDVLTDPPAVPLRTPIDLEVGPEVRRGYTSQPTPPTLDPQFDVENFDVWTQTRLAELRAESDASSGHTDSDTDTMVTHLLTTTDTISQSNWATAHVDSATYLFGGWTRLLSERRKKEAAYYTRHNMDVRAIKKLEWGFDRFGCVSDLG